MGAVLNGLAAHGSLRPFGATFLVFSDYLRPALRLSALMQLPVIYVFTHDSVGMGEDGPTHQPIEHPASLPRHPRTHRAAPRRVAPQVVGDLFVADISVPPSVYEPMGLHLPAPSAAGSILRMTASSSA